MQDGVGQLAFTFAFPSRETKDEAEETQDNGSEVSIQPAAVRSKRERKRKWHSLIDKVYALPNLQLAWERVRANRGAPGVDGMTIERYAEDADVRLQRLSEDLRAKTYRPQPVRRVFIDKSGGGQRPLGIPTVRDRIVQQALLHDPGTDFRGEVQPAEPRLPSRSGLSHRPGRGGPGRAARL